MKEKKKKDLKLIFIFLLSGNYLNEIFRNI